MEKHLFCGRKTIFWEDRHKIFLIPFIEKKIRQSNNLLQQFFFFEKEDPQF